VTKPGHMGHLIHPRPRGGPFPSFRTSDDPMLVQEFLSLNF